LETVFTGQKTVDPTNSIKVLKEEAVKEKTPKTKKTQITYAYTQKIVDKYSIQV